MGRQSRTHASKNASVNIVAEVSAPACIIFCTMSRWPVFTACNRGLIFFSSGRLTVDLSCSIRASDLAKEIYRIKPTQRIVLTTTNPLYGDTDGIKSFRGSRQDVLVKPFRLSNLINAIYNKLNSRTLFEQN